MSVHCNKKNLKMTASNDFLKMLCLNNRTFERPHITTEVTVFDRLKVSCSDQNDTMFSTMSESLIKTN